MDETGAIYAAAPTSATDYIVSLRDDRNLVEATDYRTEKKNVLRGFIYEDRNIYERFFLLS